MERLIELEIGGMTCAACANRIEKKLNRLDGVTATVNYATEKARARVPASVTAADLIAVVEKTGYTATEPAAHAGEPRRSADPLRTRLIVSAVLSVPVIVLAMVPAWQFTYWQWLSLTLAAPVVVYGGWPFHRAMAVNLRHGAATMDTLVSVGTLAAFGWSLWALFLGDAGMPGMTHPFSLTARGGDAIYLEAAAGVTTFLLAGRYLEARAKRRAGDALRALLELGAKTVTVVRDGAEHADPGRPAGGRRRVPGPPGREGRHRRRGRGRRLRAGREPADRRVGAGRGAAGRPGDRRDGQRRRTAARPGHPGRRRHPARADGPAGRGGAGRQGARCSGWPTGSPAVFVPVVLALAAGTLGYWLGTGAGRDGGVHRRGGRTDHRLPVRARPGHARPRCWSAPAGAPSWAS